MRAASSQEPTIPAVLPTCQADWVAWLDSNFAEFQTVMREAASKRRLLNLRLRPQQEYPASRQPLPRVMAMDAWARQLQGDILYKECFSAHSCIGRHILLHMSGRSHKQQCARPGHRAVQHDRGGHLFSYQDSGAKCGSAHGQGKITVQHAMSGHQMCYRASQ